MNSTKPGKFYFTTIAKNFDALMDPYDLQRRLDIVFDELLPGDLAGLEVLDAGCGTGWFSSLAHKRGARVTSLDLGLPLLRETTRKAVVSPIMGDSLRLPFCDGAFDALVSSEMIEHTEDPALAVREMGRVLKPGGLLALTCPNRLWLPIVKLAGQLRLRPFHGHEDSPGYRQLEGMVNQAGLRVEEHFGFHPWPFQIQFLRGVSRQVDLWFGRRLAGHWMINQAVLGRKESPGPRFAAYGVADNAPPGPAPIL
jgi:2-polyprenyl-3-methyl-5-hydroxy-6-metoxy-1,4-benzoquinol methylase